jgi:MFS family permease
MAESEQAPLVGTTSDGGDGAADGLTPWWQRWRFRTALTAALGEAIVYGQRISVPIALVVMQAELSWTKETQGIVMTGFWLGYAAMQIPGGWLTTRWGARRVVGAGLCASSLLHLCMPAAAVVSPGAMVGLRVLQGISQGVMVPGYAVLWSTWAPPAERSRLSSMPQIGGYVGQIFQLALAGWQLDLGATGPLSLLAGWEAVFVLNAVLGLVWMALWFSVVYDCPSQHPSCPAAERAHIERALAAEVEAADRAAAAAAAAAGNDTKTEEPVEHSEWSCALYRRMARCDNSKTASL